MHTSATQCSYDLHCYFASRQVGLEVIADDLPEVRFGEFLVARRMLDRAQLLQAIQYQDRHAGVPLGQAAVALGFVSPMRIEQAHQAFRQLPAVLVD